MDRTFYLSVVIVLSSLLALASVGCGERTRLELHDINGQCIEVNWVMAPATVDNFVEVCLCPSLGWNRAILIASGTDSIHIEALSDSVILAEIYWLNQSQEMFLADTLHIELHDNMKCIDWKSPGPDGRKAKGL